MKHDNKYQCFTCGGIFFTHQKLFSHLDSFHTNEMDSSVTLSRREHSISFLLTNRDLNPDFGQTTPFQNNYHNSQMVFMTNNNQPMRFQNVYYPATILIEKPNSQMVSMTNNNNTNFIVGHHVQPKLKSQSLQMQPQPQSRPQPQPQLQPQLQLDIEEDISTEDEVCILPLIEQMKREWPEIIVIEDDEEDSMDLELKL